MCRGPAVTMQERSDSTSFKTNGMEAMPVEGLLELPRHNLQSTARQSLQNGNFNHIQSAQQACARAAKRGYDVTAHGAHLKPYCIAATRPQGQVTTQHGIAACEALMKRCAGQESFTVIFSRNSLLEVFFSRKSLLE